MTKRIEPTPDDLAIVQRHIRRMLDWTLAENARRRARGVGPVSAIQHLHNTRRAVTDMLVFGP